MWNDDSLNFDQQIILLSLLLYSFRMERNEVSKSKGIFTDIASDFEYSYNITCSFPGMKYCANGCGYNFIHFIDTIYMVDMIIENDIHIQF